MVEEENEVDEGEMKTRVIYEKPVVTLQGYDDYEMFPREHTYKIYIQQIKEAEVGASWWSPPISNTRSSREETATLVYKNKWGAGLLIETRTYTDTPDPEEYIDHELIWVVFGTPLDSDKTKD